MNTINESDKDIDVQIPTQVWITSIIIMDIDVEKSS